MKLSAQQKEICHTAIDNGFFVKVERKFFDIFKETQRGYRYDVRRFYENGEVLANPAKYF